ncbi:UV-damage endonuclease [Cytospora mali]|uniref:UV-damage endonuclease n=1 Tax=Cytospora mali TaxID=578113 RepID=A0A194W365_CYTMA|nr:UV-damage endonuclease [Valsa mali]
MPSRGKKGASAATDAAPPPAADAPQNKTTPIHPDPPEKHTPEVTSSPPKRRSTRQAASSRKATDGQDKKGVQLSQQPAKVDKMKTVRMHLGESAGKGREDVPGAKRAVTGAMQTLEEMEQSFKRDIKRRKLELEQSIVNETEGQGRARAFSPGKLTRARSDVLKVDGLLLTPERETCEGGVAIEDVWEPAMGAEAEETADGDITDRGAKRPPPVNSDYLPLPWKGRLGYACLNTYLRAAKPTIFCSRTCRVASILEHRHPLADPSQSEHSSKNRPDKNQKADIALGQKYVESLGLANARDIVKMLRWNDKYGIKFMRLSSEIFPFASHEEYGYKLAPFASEVLAEAGKVAAELGHRLTTHPGQLGSPRKQVVANAIRDLEYHDEMLSLLKLPPQQDRDAVMILHMGGTFNEAGGKPATLDRFRQNYATLSDSVKRRLVLENDDVAWSVHDLLPICEELNIPLVLDYHHHNIVFDPTQCREGTYDISQPEISLRIANTWTRKGIKQKMHYSEPCAGAVTPRDRRKHSARVATLPPCPPDMDLMIEAKDKEQAVFDLMRRFKLPGHERIADVVAFEREDQDRAAPPVKKVKKAPRKKKGKEDVENEDEAQGEETEVPTVGALTVTPEEFGMGGPMGRVYWPVGFEEWLAPKRKEKKVKVEPSAE